MSLNVSQRAALELERRKRRKRMTPDYRSSLRILNKNLQLVPFKPNAVQQDYAQKRTQRNLILKARQLGFSTSIQAEHFAEAITHTTLSATLAHDDATTQKLRRMADRFWSNLDNPPKRGLANATTTTYPDTQSEVTIATAGSGNVGRGGTYNRVHGSEVAFWKDADAIMAGIMQGVPLDGVIELESTPNGAQGWFYERCMEALDGNSDWKLHFYQWWHDSGYQIALEPGEQLVYTPEEQRLVDQHGLTAAQIKWRRKKQRELTPRLFQQEYPEDPHSCFLASGNGYFSDIDLTNVLTAVNSEPSDRRRIVGGLDFGQTNDFTVLSLGDADSLQEVSLLRVNRLPWEDIRRRVVDECIKWNVRVLYPEWNSIGGPNMEALRKEFAARGYEIALIAFKTTPQSKPPLITGFHYALGEAGLKLLHDPVGRQELLSFTAMQAPSGAWKYEGLPHDDTVIARAIMWHAIAGGSQLTMGSAPNALNDFFGGYG
jgi:hypothetical protein